jgi:transcriptional accessory protein Tex/SPT6
MMISKLTDLAREFKVSLRNVESALALLKSGATVHYLARYQRDASGGMDAKVATLTVASEKRHDIFFIFILVKKNRNETKEKK